MHGGGKVLKGHGLSRALRNIDFSCDKCSVCVCVCVCTYNIQSLKLGHLANQDTSLIRTPH